MTNAPLPGQATTASAVAPQPRVLTSQFRPGLGLSQLRGYGDLIRLLAERDLKLRYAQTVLGPLWVILQPLIPALLFTLVFTKVVRVDTNGVPYLLLVTTAMVPWTFVTKTLQRGGPALIADRQLISRVYFPRLVSQVANLCTALVDLVLSLGVVAFAMVHASWAPSWRIVVLPLLVLWACVLALGLATLSAAASVRRRDVANMLPFFTQAWLYLTPVAYPVPSASGLRTLVLLNPMTPLVEAFRWSVFGRIAVGPGVVAGGVATALAVAVAGLLMFRRADWDLADVL